MVNSQIFSHQMRISKLKSWQNHPTTLALWYKLREILFSKYCFLGLFFWKPTFDSYLSESVPWSNKRVKRRRKYFLYPRSLPFCKKVKQYSLFSNKVTQYGIHIQNVYLTGSAFSQTYGCFSQTSIFSMWVIDEEWIYFKIIILW